MDKNEELTFGKHVVQLEILSDLRNLQPLLTKTIDAMPLVYDINKDVRFNQGIEKGIEKGREEEAAKKDYFFVSNLLINTDIVHLTDEQIAGLANGTVAFVQTVKHERAEKKETPYSLLLKSIIS